MWAFISILIKLRMKFKMLICAVSTKNTMSVKQGLKKIFSIMISGSIIKCSYFLLYDEVLESIHSVNINL